jgi:hypothetical protein
MLRGTVIALGVVLVVIGLLLALGQEAWLVPVLGTPLWSGIGPLFFGVMLLVSLVYDRRHKQDTALPPGEGWEFTGEKFIDPATGEAVEVWNNRLSGERRYVAGRK